MNIFFTTRHQYVVYDSIENVRDEIKSVINRKSLNFSRNLTGRFYSDTEFIATPKWSFAIIHWIETDLTYLKGKLANDLEKTIIHVTVRPNSIFVILFYIFAALSFSQLVGISRIGNDDPVFRFLFFPLFVIIVTSLMIFSTNRLRVRFERHLRLTPE